MTKRRVVTFKPQATSWQTAYVGAKVYLEVKDGEWLSGEIVSRGNKLVTVKLEDGRTIKRLYKDVYYKKEPK